MAHRKDPFWRDHAAAELAARHLRVREGGGSALVMGDPLATVGAAFRGHGVQAFTWNRRALGGQEATPWPPPGPFAWVALRLPRSKEELLMTLHGAAASLEEGGHLLVYGAKDEGIESAPAAMEGLFTEVVTLGVGGRCRVLGAVGTPDPPEVRGTLAAWRQETDPGYPGLPPSWVSFPGVFAHGHLDPGTRLLLDALPPFPRGGRVLDYGCGSGWVGAAVQARGEGVQVDLLDVDAVALEAARANVPGARYLLHDGLLPPGQEPYDAVVTNPPFHRGKAEESGLVVELIRHARACLVPEGRLVLVAQRRLRLEEPLREGYRQVNVLAEDPTFRVWEGRSPVR